MIWHQTTDRTEAGGGLNERQHRPDWQRLLADTDYYARVLAALFRGRGYQVRGWQSFRDPLDEDERVLLFALRAGETQHAALCVRWIIPVTSEVVGRFGKALATTQASAGLIVTTSIFTKGALETARDLPVELCDRQRLMGWIDRAWPARRRSLT